MLGGLEVVRLDREGGVDYREFWRLGRGVWIWCDGYLGIIIDF